MHIIRQVREKLTKLFQIEEKNKKLQRLKLEIDGAIKIKNMLYNYNNSS